MHWKLALFAAFAAAMLCAFAQAPAGKIQGQPESEKPRLHGYFLVKPAPNRMDVDALASLAASGPTQTLPLTTFTVDSPRDGNHYRGVLVGKDPFNRGGSVSVPTYIVPLVIRTHQVGTSIDAQTGVISTKPGTTTFNPSAAETACLSSPNDIPLTLFQQSPIFKSATFAFGGTVVGTTQYEDAFQRANFWKVDDHDTYHVLLGPVKTVAPIVLDAPAAYGLALSRSALGPPALCAPLGIIDIAWFDPFLTNTVIPALAAQGINPSSFPIFLVHNLVWASPVTNFHSCCIFGYHGATGVPLPIQTYTSLDFDSTGGSFKDTYTASHEVGEWINDPFGTNPAPLWGHTGQVSGCQGDLEVGDPLSGRTAQPLRIAMPNGFTYHLQELAFFSWFFGAPSVGVNSWFSNNATFLTDAGPPCS